MSVLADQYRCPDAYDAFKVRGDLRGSAGLFEFNRGVVCYGRTTEGSLRERVDGKRYNAMLDVAIENAQALLPFDPSEVITNLRCERYAQQPAGLVSSAIKKAYYTLRPLMPIDFRKHLQRVYLNSWRQITFPRWPVDRTVENIFEQMVTLSLESRQEPQMPFVWFWPAGHSACLTLTHDVETAAGRDWCGRLVDLDSSFGLKSSFQLVPEESYEVRPSFLDSLRERGREVNLHGLTHDGQLFRDRNRFLEDVKKINRYAKEWGAAGFRSPVMYRNLEWYENFDFSYDMSVPNAAHLDPQRGGCCTVMPYSIGHIMELPLTTTQDYSLFHILGERSIDLWKQQIDLVLEKHGLLSFNIHPDYVMTEPYRSLYQQLLQYLAQVCEERNVWIALPREVDSWWRQRQNMHVANRENVFDVAGPHSDSATVAYAQSDNGRIVYDISKPKPAMKSASVSKDDYVFREAAQ